MEFLIIIAIIVVFLLIMGETFLPVIAGILWLFEGMSLLCTVFFAGTAVLILLAKRKEAVFQRVEKAEKYGDHAVYLIDGEEYGNLFPTDGFMKKLLYRKKETTVRVLGIGEKSLVFDRVSWLITGIGLAAFTAISAMLYFMIA